jgi:hypothetical protein
MSRVGLVVDSELGKIEKINNGILPYIGSFLLPSHIKLLYASDAASDTLQNQMIKYCHRAALSAKKAIIDSVDSIPWNDCPFCDGVIEVVCKHA